MELLSCDPLFIEQNAPVPDKLSDSKYIRCWTSIQKLQFIDIYNMKYEDMARLDLQLEDLKDLVYKHYDKVIQLIREEKKGKISTDNDLFNHFKILT